MINVTLYQRADCHLCEQVKSDLEEIQSKIPHQLVLIDIDSDPAMKDLFAMDIPVIEVGPYRLKYPFSKQELEMTLSAAVDRKSQLERVDDQGYHQAVERGKTITKADKISLWLSRNYLLILNLLVLLYVGLPFTAPVFKEVGANGAAEVIYRIYRPLCHQWSFRSWFLFGEQAYYPHETAKIAGVLTFEGVSGITDANDPNRVQARLFEGNELLGFKVGLCERDVAIWGSILLFGVIFAISHRRIKGLHWLVWLLVGIGPIALDGVSQLISQLNLPFLQGLLPYRESTPFIRTLTGFLFGFMTAWYGFPTIEEAMADTRRILTKKIAVVSHMGQN
ncbi:MAG: hypothetical protein A2X25_04315 [Chloroflexi bacterium GWB2_49_20]|nr:MAG: hypothetical protein A2X25_04315 [Chloroflexi bacterium GWB2_49_20]OGN78605.1 MAG: hypothetical protein A2X26_12375 [Chloroflexi bacterium GWC2_49_37]OGN85707.1 MAG: hypothetical protein A2X27_00845 [Chloroflexi bacterium GWD2_49_16]HBG75070.1 hypothetical protein [Anaerolineae bacterium]HCC78095.1 hypothetical protein [Anaerolineae bacterium]